VLISPYQPEDAVAFVKLLQRRENDPLTLETFQEQEAEREPNAELWRVLSKENEKALGAAELSVRPSTPHGWRDASIIVAADAEHQGFGSTLLEALLTEARRAGLIGLETSVRDTDPNSRSWLERRGFEFDFHRFESALHLSDYQSQRFADVVPRAESRGVRFATAAEFGTEAGTRTLHALDNRLFLDTPDAPGRTPLSFERFKKLVFQNPRAAPEGVIVAMRGDAAVGMTITLRERKDEFYTGMTGVDREYRGLGIALALKVLSIQHAIQAGAESMTTHNHSKNAPMIAINQKLGYRQRPGLWVLKRHLRPNAV
jgi:GNAT superfamily N-acetyltransferase